MNCSQKLSFILLSSCLVLTGCWSQKELTDLALISAMGIDLTEDGRFLATLQVINPSNVAGGLQGGGGGSDAPPVFVYSATGDNLFEVNRRASAQLPRRRYYAHTNLIVLGEEVVQKVGIGAILDALERHPEIRMTATIIIAKGAMAKDLLSIVSRIDKIPANKIIKNLKFTEEQWGEFFTLNLQDAIKDMTSPGKAPLITGFEIKGDPEKGKKLENIQSSESPATIQASSLGIIRDGKLIDWVEGHNARGMVWLLDKIKMTELSVDWKGKKDAVVYLVLRQNTKTKATIKGGKPVINVHVEAEGVISEVLVVPLDLTDPHQLLKIEKKLEKRIKQELTNAVKEAQKKQADVFGFGQAVYRTDPKMWNKWKDEWHEAHFPDLEVKITVDAYIRSTGLRNKPSIINKEGG